VVFSHFWGSGSLFLVKLLDHGGDDGVGGGGGEEEGVAGF
jgi:hypothetical protein